MGLVWRPARRDPRRLVEKAQVTPGVFPAGLDELPATAR